MRLVIALLLLAAGVLWFGKAEWLAPGGSSMGGAPTPTAARPAAPAIGRASDVVVEISEGELNRAVGERLTGRSFGSTPLGEAMLEQVRVSLYQGRAEANGTARLGGVSVPFSSQLTATAEDGGVRLAISDAKLGGVPLPESARTSLERALQGEVDRLIRSQPVRVTRVDIEPGRLRASGTPRG